MRLFLDTSVLLGFFDNDERFKGAAQRLAAMEILGDAELWVYAQSYVEAHTLLSMICTDEAILPAFGASLELFSVCALDGDHMQYLLGVYRTMRLHEAVAPGGGPLRDVSVRRVLGRLGVRAVGLGGLAATARDLDTWGEVRAWDSSR